MKSGGVSRRWVILLEQNFKFFRRELRLSKYGSQDLWIQIAGMIGDSDEQVSPLELNVTASLPDPSKTSFFERNDNLTRSKYRQFRHRL